MTRIGHELASGVMEESYYAQISHYVQADTVRYVGESRDS